MEYSKIDGNDSLIRDEKTSAVLNTDHLQYLSYINVKKSKERETQKINFIENQLIELRKEIDDIKQSLRRLENYGTKS